MARGRYELSGLSCKGCFMKYLVLTFCLFLSLNSFSLPLNVIYCENVRIKLQSIRITAPERAALLVLKAQLQCTYF